MKAGEWSLGMTNIVQGVVTPIGTVVTAKTGVKKWSTGQGVFLPLVKQSRTIIFTSPHSVRSYYNYNGVYINAQG